MEKLQPRRLVLLVTGMLFMAFGIALSVRSDLGTTTISSLPYVLSLISPLTLGMTTIIFNIGLVLIQVLLLRSRFQAFQLLQIPLAVVFGLFNDLALWLTSWVTYSAYWQQWLIVLIGLLLLSTGICFQISANTLMLAGEAVVLAISTELSRVFGKRRLFVFGHVKIGFDLITVISAIILGLLFAGAVVGVREGTVAAAFLIGTIVKRVQPVIGPPLVRFRGGA
ncbi:DUF6198 family protein [Corynebacterium sp. YIM 101645]|uniref:DUF6198 family protein n=1 Tax=Corynebacterium lemuris TaxID=1859292 RepID=A0ABT2FSX4_9CORY|nr:DUF6198 family protein [Corynebacterium lemuris]MCS5478319.1 DUF6198 family protein [Corynebacterium lemuris]